MRLIDADEFKKQIAGMAIINNFPADKANTMCELIDAQPTAYDLGKVAEQLEELKAIKDGCIPIIHGQEELKLHDREIRNKAIDDFRTEICKAIVQSEKNGNYRFYAVETKQYIADLAEQLKAGDGD